jgi:hypothetical protein
MQSECARLAFPYFKTLPHKGQDIWKKVIIHTMFALIFSLQL